MRLHLCLAIVLQFAASSFVIASESHCTKQETVFFNCPIANSKKVLSVCGDRRIDPTKSNNQSQEKNLYIQYRFGEIGNVEMQFPKLKKGSLNLFQYRRIYAKTAGAYLEELSFQNSGYTYEVFYDEQLPDGSNKLVMTYGVRINRANGGYTTISCSKKPVVRLELLQNHVSGD